MSLKDIPLITPATAHLPKYRQIAAAVEEYLYQTKLPEGERFFSDRALAQRFSTTSVTVAHSLQYLSEKGLLTRLPGSGTYVGKLRPERKSQRRIGIICHQMVCSDETYVAPILRSFGSFFESRNYECISFRGEPADYNRLINDYMLSGVMIFVPKEEFANDLLQLYNQGIPVVSIGYAMPELPFMSFGTDHALTVAMAVKYVYGLGHRKIALLYNASQASSSVFFRSYRQTMWDLQLPIHPQWEINSDEGLLSDHIHTVEKKFDQLASLLNTGNMPTAILLKNVFDAVAVYNFAAKNNLRIPEDLSLVTFDDSVLALQLYPQLTVFKQDLEAISNQAANTLLAMIERRFDKSSVVHQASQLIERGSCCRIQE